MAKAGIKAFAPATITNLCVGYGVLGCAVEHTGVEILIREGQKPGLTIENITGAFGKVLKETEMNVAGLAALKLLNDLDQTQKPLEMDIHFKMPINKGMGSAAASAAGALFAVSEFLKAGLSKQELLSYAVESLREITGSAHLNHLIPSLMGGLTICNPATHILYKKLHTPAGIYIVLISPDNETPKIDFDSTLNNQLTFEKTTAQQAALGSFITAMYTTDIPLLNECMSDYIVEPYISEIYPHYNELKKIAEEENAPGFGITGRGPAMFALCDNSLKAENIGKKAEMYFANTKRKVKCNISKINQQGTVLF